MSAVKDHDELVPVSFRMRKSLAERLRQASLGDRWPPPPTQTEIVTRGIELVLRELEKRKPR